MVVSKETKCLQYFTINKTDQSHVNEINAVRRNFLEEFLKTIHIKMSISDFNKVNTIKYTMSDSQTTITGYAPGMTLPLSKEGVSQVAVADPYSS